MPARLQAPERLFRWYLRRSRGEPTVQWGERCEQNGREHCSVRG